MGDKCGPQMRLLLLTTATVVMALLLLTTATVAMAVMSSGTASAESQIEPDPTALPHSPTPWEPTFSKDPLELRPILNAEDAAFAEQLRDLTENKLQKYVPRQQDRDGIA